MLHRFSVFPLQNPRSEFGAPHSIEVLVSAVAARFVAGVFAGTEVSVFVFLGSKHVRYERRAFVLAVAERLPFGKSASAERIFFASLKRDLNGSPAGDCRFV